MTTTCDACALPLRALRKVGEGFYCPPCAADIEAVKEELVAWCECGHGPEAHRAREGNCPDA